MLTYTDVYPASAGALDVYTDVYPAVAEEPGGRYTDVYPAPYVRRSHAAVLLGSGSLVGSPVVEAPPWVGDPRPVSPRLTWRVVDARTGVAVEELPGAVLKSDLVQLIGRGEAVTVEVPWPGAPDRWQTATTPGRMVLICEDERRIWWGGLITERRLGSGATMTLSASPPEQLLARSYVPSHRHVQARQTDLMAWLGLEWLAAGFHGRVEVGPTSTVRDRTYSDDDDKPRLDAMQDLMGVINGPEFTVRWETRQSGAVGLVAIAADRLGDRQGPIEHELYPDEWALTDSYAAGKGATVVRASKTKDAEDGGEQEKVWQERRAQDLLDAGWLPIEERFTPETGSVSPAVIGEYADGRLADLRDGTVTIEAKLLLEEWPPEMHLGDTVRVVLRNPDIPSLDWLSDGDADSALAVSDARVVGWHMAAEQGEVTHVTPVLELGRLQWQ